MKNKVLIIFKYPHFWNEVIIKKFSNFYETEFIYINEYKDKNYTDVINEINNLISLKKISIAVFDVDYFKFINLFFIKKINVEKKILITGDDFELHEVNAITASACDLILSGCPLSVLKYKEKGYEAHAIYFEDGNLIKKENVKKEIDVLFFGVVTDERKSFLDFIVQEGISLKNIGHEEKIEGIPANDLLKLISKSKIVLNLSKTRTSAVRSYTSENIYKFYYQIKGRLCMAGLNGAACVSEYSPGQELIFKDGEVPTFYTKEECVKILKNLLSNDELLKNITKKFNSRAHELLEDKKNFQPIYNAIEKSKHEKVKLIKIPYWYLRISAKQIILRNIKLSALFKSIFQLSEIFLIVKNSNFLTKILIISESILNILWHSVILTFKSKK